MEGFGGNQRQGIRGAARRQCFDSGRAARSGGSHYLHISSVKLIVFTASLHEPTCHSNLVCGRHSSVPAKCGKRGHLRQARTLIDKEIKKQVGLGGGGLGGWRTIQCGLIAQLVKSSRLPLGVRFTAGHCNATTQWKPQSFNESASATEISMLILLSSATLAVTAC